LSAADESPLRVAIDFDIPPYIKDGATDGLEVAILKRALDGDELLFIQMPFNQINTAIETDSTDVAVSVVKSDRGGYYSDFFISFENYAISLTAEGLEIDQVGDLAGLPVLTWQGAYSELGSAFEAMFRPGGPDHADYVEVADLKELVERFWQQRNAVAVIDRNIFRYFTEQIGRSIDNVRFHDLFAPASEFRVGFRDEAVRDRFNAGLAELCSSGEYAVLLKRYGVIVRRSVCDR